MRKKIMRKAFYFGLLALVLMVVGISEVTDAKMDIPGKWSLTYDWGCTGSLSKYALYIYPNHNFKSADGGYGTWTETGSTVKLIYSNGCKPKYTGTFSNGRLNLEGTMKCTPGQMKLTTGGVGNGCWNAVKTNEPLPSNSDTVDSEAPRSSRSSSATP